jgi:diguanylate cyclase (GGDEF)-like protein
VIKKQLQIDQVQYSIVSPACSMTTIYIITLSAIAGFSMLIHFMLGQIIEQQAGTAQIVNISGQQRMLSQRASLLTVEYLTSGKVEFKQEALNTLKAMNKNHKFLLKDYVNAKKHNHESPMSKPLQQLYFGQPHHVDQKIRAFSEFIVDALNNGLLKGIEERKYVGSIFKYLADDMILDSLNAVVSQYQTESEDIVRELHQIQQLVFFFIFLTILAEALFVFRPMVERIKYLQQQADRDHLTGLFNRRSLEVLAKKTFTMAAFNSQKVSVITFDIDRFKVINDTYGHDVGDKAIQYVSELIMSCTRDSDIVSRYGGEEFVVLLPQTSQEHAMVLAEKIRIKIQNSPLALNELMIEMTVSGGVSQYLETEKGWFDILKRSDGALYQAKNSGRNKICMA